jgi:magnesium transporter
MLQVFSPQDGKATTLVVTADTVLPETARWIDLFQPTEAEETLVERALGIDVPTREEMKEIEETSRLYREGGALFMTAHIICAADTDTPRITPITFILADDRLVTVRYDDPASFRSFIAQVARRPALCASGSTALIGLLEAIVDRIADVLERVGSDVEDLSSAIFDHGPGVRLSSDDFSALLRRVGKTQGRTAKVRDSLVSLNRLLSFLALPREASEHKELRDHVDSLTRDVLSLTHHASSIAGIISFQLDALLGMINVEQNGIIKIFSVASVALMPPTLIASIYGMNFKSMPELDLPYAYPLALAAMIASAVLPYLYFKHRGWL